MRSINIPYIYHLSEKGKISVSNKHEKLFFLKKNSCNYGTNKAKLYVGDVVRNGIYDIIFKLESKEDSSINSTYKTRLNIMGDVIEEKNHFTLSKQTYDAKLKEKDGTNIFSYNIKAYKKTNINSDLDVHPINLPKEMDMDYELLSSEELEDGLTELKIKLILGTTSKVNMDIASVLQFECCGEKRFGYFNLNAE